MTGLLAALAVVAGGIAALLLNGPGIWFQISCQGRLGRLLTAWADLRTSPGKHLGLSPASATGLSASRWQGSGKLALPGQA